MKNLRMVLFLALVLLLAGCQGVTPDLEYAGAGNNNPDWAEPGGFETVDETMGVNQSPPVLTLLYDGGSAETHLGTYSWNYDKGDGTWSGIIADALHPLDCQKFLQPISASQLYAELLFSDTPDSYTIRCWHDSQWGNYDAQAEAVAHHGNVFELMPGGYIYEVTATWDEDGGAFYGTARYSFYVTAGIYGVMPIDK